MISCTKQLQTESTKLRLSVLTSVFLSRHDFAVLVCSCLSPVSVSSLYTMCVLNYLVFFLLSILTLSFLLSSPP